MKVPAFLDILPDPIVRTLRSLIADAVEGEKPVSVTALVTEMHSQFPNLYFPRGALEKEIIKEAAKLDVRVQLH